jgi:hypothetical protein
MNKSLNKTENEILAELQNTIYQGSPLIDLVNKNYTERNQSNEQIANTLYGIVCEGKVQLSEQATMQNIPYDKLIIAHYEQLHNMNKK